MSDYKNDPNNLYDQPAQQVRHRRSDRHKGAEAPEVQPRGAARREEKYDQVEERQWVRRQPEMPQEEQQAQPGPRRPQPQRVVSSREDQFMRRPVALEVEEEYEDDEDERRFPWLKVLLAAVLVVLIACAALYFVPSAGPLQGVKETIVNLVNGRKEPGQALSFQTANANGVTDSRIQFHLTTNKTVDAVRIQDEAGNEISYDAKVVNGENETNKIWQVNVVFDAPYTGDVYAAIRTGDQWETTDKKVALVIAAPTPVPTATPAPTPVPTQAPVITPAPQITAAPVLTEQPGGEESAVVVPVPTWAPAITSVPAFETTATPKEAPTQAPATPAPTLEPTPEPTLEPTPVPTPEPTATPTPVPTASPVPRLEAQSGGNVKSTEAVYQGSKALKSFSRSEGYIAPNPDRYSYYDIGVLTFRGDNFRRNAAFGTTNVQQEKMSVLWKSAIGSLRTEDNGTLYGVGWTGQPAIVKWTKEVREMMNIKEEKKNTSALREVIFGAQDGKIYFLDLTDGQATRDPINVGFPLKGSVSIDAQGRPLLAVGQGISKLAGKTGEIGLHVYNLVDCSKAFMINGRKSSSQVQYATNGAFDGTALFLYDGGDAKNDAMIVAGENGLLYTVDLNSKFDYPSVDNPEAKGSMSVKREITYLRAKAAGEKDNQVNVESSVAMYDKYVYFGDTYGTVRCVDTDTMKTVWAFDNGDNTDALALDMVGENVSLYTGNTAYARLTTKQDVTLRRLNALTGAEEWSYTIKCSYDKDQLSGCKASPVIGQNNIDDLVIFTVNKVEEGGSRIIALDKASGKVAWQHKLSAETISSPVAVYNEEGDAWIIQGDENGDLTLLNARTGAVRSTLSLGGKIQGSPAVYKNYLVIGTCDKDNAFMYGIKID